MLPIYLLCDGSLGDCDCISRRAAYTADVKKKSRNAHGRAPMHRRCKCMLCRKSYNKYMRNYRAEKKEN